MNYSFFRLLLLLMACSFCSCTSTEDKENLALQALDLHQKGQTFYCELQGLGVQSKNLWDSVAYSLQEKLPQDMPAEERKNMIEIRNASLIRMFEAFPKLPPEVQQSVDQAEQDDQKIATQMRALDDSLKQHDLKVGHFLETVKIQLPDSLPNWQSRLSLYTCN